VEGPSLLFSIMHRWALLLTAFVDYLLSFADQGKRTSVFRFRLQQTNGSLRFPFFVSSKQMKVAILR
jgi:hypothetical protein